MFVLASMCDTVRIKPQDLGSDFVRMARRALDTKLANKVVLNVGLCITCFDFDRFEDSYILPGGDGSAYTKIHFRYVVFRPFINEIIVGRIKSCTPDGIQIALGFFDDIHVESSRLPDNSRFDPQDQVWIWAYEDEQENVSADMYIEPGSQVRFRVIGEQFEDIVPDSAVAGAQAQQGMDEPPPIPNKQCSYVIYAAMNESGLGCLEWWK